MTQRLNTLFAKWSATDHLDRDDIAHLFNVVFDLADRTYDTVDLWPVGADDQGIWVLNPDAPRPWPTPPLHWTGEDPNPAHTAAELELIQHGIDLGRVPCLHSTSWRSDGGVTVLHYLAIVDCPGTVREHYPHAKPISPNIARVAGQPRHHGAAAPPEEVRCIDILRHGVRHYRALGDPASLCYDEPIGKALPEVWHRQLADVTPAVAQMFGPVREPA